MKLFELYGSIQTSSDAIEYLRSRRLLATNLNCLICGEIMRIALSEASLDGEIFRCRRSSCKTTKSIRTGSFFSGSKMSLKDIIIFLHLWAKEYPQHLILSDFKYANQTIVDWSRFCRDVCVNFFDNHFTDTLGGPGIVVEIDESVMVKRKYNRGRILRTQWLFGGIERRNDLVKRFFIELVDDRKKETLLPIIQRKILPDSIIISDGWASYNDLHNYGYFHEVIIHEENFINPENEQIHTQHVENMWMVLKKFLKRHGTNKSPHEFEYVAEFFFRWSSNDIYENLLSQISLIYPL